ncbi:hypothetical protein RGQ13_03210 [Thalassotalea psychrophila]|uniref:Uncharacterized protein n=1 Tax=Thalassotalea psychrophila TaxID=3065647 RepID=A0ABY9TW11_9GAMM|nr:hypothetical protein RGQ13_03210 [Colwelliaceae bacterium SQ149]
MTRSLFTALVISLVIHALLIWGFLFTPIPAPKNIKKLVVKQNTPIRSYIYQAPQVIAKPIIENKQPLETVNKSVIKSKEIVRELVNKTKENEPVNVSKIVTVNKQPIKAPATKVPPKFNPYNSINSFKQQLNQEMMSDFKEEQLNQGFSAMQILPKSVPHSVFHKSELQRKAEATTQIGNETFVKQNGVCMQTTDLSFIDDNLGSVTSFSDCGESDEEKYFREFMAKKMSRFKNK